MRFKTTCNTFFLFKASKLFFISSFTFFKVSNTIFINVKISVKNVY